MTLITLSTYQFFHTYGSSTLDIVLPGKSGGIANPFIQKIVSTSQEMGHDVVAINFPFQDRQETEISGSDLIEEVTAVKNVLSSIDISQYKHINFAGKSLGGLVAMKFLHTASDMSLSKRLIIFGLLPNFTDPTAIPSGTVLIQGTQDPYVSADVLTAYQNVENVHVVLIEGADHSFRDANTKEPIYEEGAIAAYMEYIKYYDKA